MKEYIFKYEEGIPTDEGDYIFIFKDNSLVPGYVHKPGPLTDISEPSYYTIGSVPTLLTFKPKELIKGYCKLEPHQERILSDKFYRKDPYEEKGDPNNPLVP